MRFRYAVIIYILIWIFLIAGVCIYEWNILERFQFTYMDEEARKAIKEEMKASADNSGKENGNDRAQTAETTGKDSVNLQENTNEIIQPVTIIADNTMTIYVNGMRQDAEIKEEIEDGIYEDLSGLLGKEIKMCLYSVETGTPDSVSVADDKGNFIMPQGNDYVKGAYTYDRELAQTAILKFEYYLKHVSGLVTLNELTAVMRTDSKAYKAVRDSQQSLEWMIKAKSIEFTREEVSDMRIFDENHFVCDVNIDLTKVSDTERERVVEETVCYRVLFEKINGEWYIYSFLTK